jgi:RNA polymerase sigma factor (sigma-70 family)
MGFRVTMRTSPSFGRLLPFPMKEPDRPPLSDETRASIENAWANRFPRWRAYALSLTGNQTDAEEIVQEAISRTMNAAPALATEQDAYHYVLSAIRSSAYQLFSRRSRKRELTEREQPVDVASDPLRRVLDSEAAQQRRQLRAAALRIVRDLDPLQRETIELLVLRDPPLKLREVAAIQDAPISTVYSRLQAALRAIGRELGGR